MPIRSAGPMRDVVRAAYEISWIMMGLLLLLSAMATALGAVGVYAVLAQHVALKRRTIGIRMALGAEPERVVTGIVTTGLKLAIFGVGLGGLMAVATNRLLASVVFEVSTLSPLAFISAGLGVTVATLVAAWIPAVRAARVPPAEIVFSE